MAGLVPAIHVFDAARKTWMPGTRLGMTKERFVPITAQSSDPNGRIS
jgi:hypothetical protein